MSAPRLHAADVAVGDRLPPLEVEITARTVVIGASASRDWQPQHHDHRWAVERAGTRDIFLNTPTQAGWIERYLTSWAGPTARLGRLTFRMRRSVFPGDRLVFAGEVTSVDEDADGCTWMTVDLDLSVDGETATRCTARLALPSGSEENPWVRTGDSWVP